VVLVGYIDESYSGENPPLTFGLSCLIAWGNEWPWIELAWNKVLEAKNSELINAGRKPIARFHAADMNALAGDFKGWDGPERTEFTQRLVEHVFRRHDTGFLGYTLSLRDISEVWPKGDALFAAYYMTTQFLIFDLPGVIEQRFPDAKGITLIHDRCGYDGAILKAFDHVRNDQDFRHRDMFTTIAPMGWENCVPLQPADFCAYESMKESHRVEPDVKLIKERPMRKSLDALLDLDSFTGATYHVSKEALALMKDRSTTRNRAT
jgi:hypothetical protein